MSNLQNIDKSEVPTHMVRFASLELNRKTKNIMGAYVERQKRPGEVQAPDNNLWQRGHYRTGDGDHTAQVPREGSLRAFSLPSRGNRT